MGHPEALLQIVSKDKMRAEKNETMRTNDDSGDGQEEGKLCDHNCRQTLSFESQELSSFPSSDVVETCIHLTSLNLNYNKICKLPEGISKHLPQLEVFYADGNELSDIPEDFGLFTCLEELSFQENNLTALPESLCKLTKLRALKVNANALRKLHSEIGQNIKLELLSVDENALKRLPATIGLLKNLQVLEANYNKLESLPSTLNFLENLRTLNLSNNRLTTIPDSLGELAKLTYVDLSENQILHLCDEFKSTATLERLYLDVNIFAKCPAWFKDLENIREITMKTNELSGLAIPDGFGLKSKHLKKLDLRGNFIEALPHSFGNLKSLNTLLLGTPMGYLERSPHFQNGNWLSVLPDNFADLKSLTELCLQENNLTELPADVGRLINLENIFLGSNMLAELPGTFSQLCSLKKCQLSKNRLKKLPDDFGRLSALTELYLDSNKLKTLPTSMKSLTSMKILDLTENRLKEVPSVIISAMTKLEALDMASNRFDVPFSEIPHIAKRTHYAEPNPEYKGNWRGRNNATESVQRLMESEFRNESNQNQELKEETSSNGSRLVDPDSSEGEDWDNEINKSNTSSASTDRVCHLICDEDEEDWEQELESTPRLNAFGIEAGQFDLDGEEPKRGHGLLPTPLNFDTYGNASQSIDLSIERHRSIPYIYHAPSINRRLYFPSFTVDGQFDDVEDGSDGKKGRENCKNAVHTSGFGMFSGRDSPSINLEQNVESIMISEKGDSGLGQAYSKNENGTGVLDSELN